MATVRTLHILAVVGVILLSGCASSAPADGGGTDGGGAAGGGDTAGGEGGSASALNCDSMTTGGWELFADPRLTIDPSSDVISLAAKKDVVTFTDTAPVGYTTYSYTLGYIDDKGSVFTSQAAIFVGAENTGSFELAGPVSPSGVTGGPYAGVLQIEATDDSGVTPIARICVLLAPSS